MDAQKRRLLRAAQEIRSCIVQVQIATHVPGHRWRRIQKLASQAESCHGLGWLRAAEQLQGNLRRELRGLAGELSSLADAMTRMARETPTNLQATFAEIFRNLLALRHEFPEAGCDLAAGTLWVVTESIVLRRVELGRFRIELDFRRVQDFQPYRVIAMEPKFPAGGREVPHPHVQYDSLCEGKGKQAVQAALRSGRIYDFFTIVARLLATYNGASAYVQLSAWNGVCCTACGDTVPGDEVIHCDRCEEELCPGCSSDCKTCGYSFCHECRTSCSRCGWAVCHSCVKACTRCGRIVCRECCNDNLCPVCRQLSQENQDESADDDESIAAETATAQEASA